MREQLVTHFEEKGLIPNQYHGGRLQHSTITSKIEIDDNIADNLVECKESLVLAN